ncbi:hypothetical protein LshimejAT787_0600390 [Lyophyllum shimeji]|uniref:Uncharacterized protein n=1 Tax=Lyophyllum shimeji TaxID=47721 RepID=A0A9P3UN17_LYOSH|nr:hypothetical protein LshimejAT787_0600390 [Lyophyllum shimeji]
MTNLNPPEPKDEKQPLSVSETEMVTETELASDAESEKRPKERVGSPRPPGPRFHPHTPSPFKRAALVIFALLLFWLALSMRQSLWTAKKKPQIIYASRYSKEHKFRPAASPIITETLKDGRIRIRGAGPTATSEPNPTPNVAKKVKRRAKSKARSVKQLISREVRALNRGNGPLYLLLDMDIEMYAARPPCPRLVTHSFPEYLLWWTLWMFVILNVTWIASTATVASMTATISARSQVASRCRQKVSTLNVQYLPLRLLLVQRAFDGKMNRRFLPAVYREEGEILRNHGFTPN